MWVNQLLWYIPMLGRPGPAWRVFYSPGVNFESRFESNTPREYVEAHFRRVMKGNAVSDLVF